ncbi:hypothetical protein STAS_08141 [Striga asiatica]|uniref:Uncharacterized protein n=1 Tax=Striga asiatica TaxID=4170 RepID=A0A5A7PHA6_STRAF|nr:hypothetical protein STAS_08141 [Striga asiatica]
MYIMDQKPQNHRKTHRNTPSFSSILLDEIYCSIDGRKSNEPKALDRMPTRKNINPKAKEKGEARRKPALIEDSFFHSSTNSSSSDSSCAFSDTEFFRTRSKVSNCFLFDERQISRRNKTEDDSVFVKPKSMPHRVYAGLKKVKQPISPGGRLTSFISSIFAGSREKKSKKVEKCQEDVLKNPARTELRVRIGGQNGKIEEASKRDFVKSKNDEVEMDGDVDDDDDFSDSSSDLFELDNKALFGNYEFCEELPVYESTAHCLLPVRYKVKSDDSVRRQNENNDKFGFISEEDNREQGSYSALLKPIRNGAAITHFHDEQQSALFKPITNGRAVTHFHDEQSALLKPITNGRAVTHFHDEQSALFKPITNGRAVTHFHDEQSALLKPITNGRAVTHFHDEQVQMWKTRTFLICFQPLTPYRDSTLRRGDIDVTTTLGPSTGRSPSPEPNRANTVSIHGDNTVNKFDGDNHTGNNCSEPELLPKGNLKEEVNEVMSLKFQSFLKSNPHIHKIYVKYTLEILVIQTSYRSGHTYT